MHHHHQVNIRYVQDIIFISSSIYALLVSLLIIVSQPLYTTLYTYHCMHAVDDLYLCMSTSGLHCCRGPQRIIKSGLFKLMQAGCNPYQELAPLDCFVHAGQYSKLCKCCNNLSIVHTSSSRVVMLHNCLYVRIVI